MFVYMSVYVCVIVFVCRWVGLYVCLCVCVGGGGGGSSGGEPKVPENFPTFLRYYVVVSVFPYSVQLSWKCNCYFYCKQYGRSVLSSLRILFTERII